MKNFVSSSIDLTITCIRQYTLSTFCCYAFLTAMTTRKQILLSEMKTKSYYAFREFKKFIQEDLDILIPIT